MNREVAATVDELKDIIRGLLYQHCGWVGGSVGGLSADFLSANEDAFEVLGWDPYGEPIPELRCKQQGCMEQSTCGWPCPDHRYHRTCGDHMRKLEGKPHEADA